MKSLVQGWKINSVFNILGSSPKDNLSMDYVKELKMEIAFSEILDTIDLDTIRMKGLLYLSTDEEAIGDSYKEISN